ncbi:MAG: RdgB/HAM1 family non-canonical purine NTP pyrophosphatase [Planctomycetota bacterium]
MRELVIATRNPHKLEEVRAILAGADVGVRSLDDLGGVPEVPEVVEDRDTFAGNAAKKAEEVARATGSAALADDSGLVVDALGGAPGVLSARYAGSDGDSAAISTANNAKLLAEMAAVGDGDRAARFVCVIALAREGHGTRLFRGETAGRIGGERKGRGGFGYDPLFVSDDLGVTFAEACPEEKNAVSHRGRALAEFAKALAAGKLDEFFG